MALEDLKYPLQKLDYIYGGHSRFSSGTRIFPVLFTVAMTISEKSTVKERENYGGEGRNRKAHRKRARRITAAKQEPGKPAVRETAVSQRSGEDQVYKLLRIRYNKEQKTNMPDGRKIHDPRKKIQDAGRKVDHADDVTGREITWEHHIIRQKKAILQKKC